MSDDADLAQRFEERERTVAVGIIVNALAAEDGDGQCALCGDPIPGERLAVHPHARRCLECQSGRERLMRLFPVKA